MTQTSAMPRAVRATLYLIAGAAVAVPLAACQPEPAPAPPKKLEPVPVPSTQVSGSEEGGVRTVIKEVIVEKPVYIEKPAVGGVAEDEVLATLGVGKDERKITLSQIKPLLMSSYGLMVLRQYTQLDMVKHAAKQREITVTAADIEAESDKWLGQMAPDAEKNEYPRLLATLLQNRKMTRAEYDLAMEINAYFRKIARTQIKAPTDEQIREWFNVMYGEKVQVRHIACNNIGEVTEAQKLLTQGMSFEDAARKVSRNKVTGQLGGELPPCTRMAQDVPEAMRDAAFGLKEGDVSDPVLADGMYHLIKLDKRIPVKAVKYEDVKDSVEKEMRTKKEDDFIKGFRETLGAQAIASMKVVEPELKKQWDALKRAAEDEKAKAATVAPGTAPR